MTPLPPTTIVFLGATLILVSVLITFLLTHLAKQQKIASLSQENVSLKAKLAAEIEKFSSLNASITHNEEHLTRIFDSISAQALQRNSQLYLQQSQEQLKGVLTPLSQDLSKLDTHIHKVEHERTSSYASLYKELENLQREILSLNKKNEQLMLSTSSLDQALRSDIKTRGKWGEIQLRRIAEMAGMVEHIDFAEQYAVRSEESRQRPDMIITLPQQGIIPVDAKAPMNNYLKASQSQTPQERAEFLDKHKKSMSDHIRTLAGKEYWRQFDNSPELVVLFVPYESGLESSLSHDPNLLDWALDSKVIIVGPSTLYALLKVISYGWMQLHLTQNVKEIASLSKKLVERFNKFGEYFARVGTQLGSAVKSFNEAEGSMRSRLFPTMRDIQRLGGSSEQIFSDATPKSIDASPRTT